MTRWVIVLLSAIPVVLFGCLLVLLAEEVRGTDFSPSRFCRRGWEFHRIPWLNIPITATVYSREPHELDAFLRQKKLVSGTSSSDLMGDGLDDWVLVRARSVNREWKGDAAILAEILDEQTENGKSIWLQWSRRHPQAAAILWPVVAETAASGLYYLIPKQLARAELEGDGGKLEAVLRADLLEELIDRSNRERRLGNQESARQLRHRAERLQSLAITRPNRPPAEGGSSPLEPSRTP